MPTEHKGQLRIVFADVLEKMAFLFAEPTSADELATDETAFSTVQIGFTGEELQGTLALTVGVPLSVMIAANVLGVEEDDGMAAERAEDALKEFLNTICGQLLTAIAGDDPVFDLTIPTVTKASSETWSDLCGDPAAVGFLIEESPAILRIEATQP